jgi:hypothetical protein
MTATDAQWTGALRAVGFSSASAAVPGDRTISFLINDGTESSVAATKSLALLPVTFRPATMPSSSALPAGLNQAVSSVTTAGDGAPLIVLAATDQSRSFGAAATLPTMAFPMNNGPLGGVLAADVRIDNDLDIPLWLLPSQSLLMSPIDTTMSIEHLNVPLGRAFSLSLQTGRNAPGADLEPSPQATLRLIDGTALPGWLHYNAATDVVSGIAPTAARELRLILTMPDHAGAVVHREIVIDFGAGAAPSMHAPAGQRGVPHSMRTPAKPSLAEQLARQRHLLHVARPRASA